MNKIVGSIRIALRACGVNRMRSALTMLGIINWRGGGHRHGGCRARAPPSGFRTRSRVIGSNLIMVMPGSVSTNGVRLGAGAVASLTQDARTRECPSVALSVLRCAAECRWYNYGNNNWATNARE